MLDPKHSAFVPFFFLSYTSLRREKVGTSGFPSHLTTCGLAVLQLRKDGEERTDTLLLQMLCLRATANSTLHLWTDGWTRYYSGYMEKIPPGKTATCLRDGTVQLRPPLCQIIESLNTVEACKPGCKGALNSTGTAATPPA